MSRQFTSLRELRNYLNDLEDEAYDRRCRGEPGIFSDLLREAGLDLCALPTFGGTDAYKEGVYSWDDKRVLTRESDTWIIRNR